MLSFNLLMILLVDFQYFFWSLLLKRTHLKGSSAKRTHQQRTLDREGEGVGWRPLCPPPPDTSSTGNLSSFHFPLKNEDLNKNWIRFLNRSYWVPTKHSVLCELHFVDIYKIKRKRMSLNWSMKPVLTIHSAELIDMPSIPSTTQTFRKPLRKRIFHEDQPDSFRIHDQIN